MATTPVEFRYGTGATLTVELYPYDSDTIANGAGDAATEETNRKGLYTISVTEALAGWHTAHIFEGGECKGVLDVELADDTNTHRAYDRPHETDADIAGVVATLANPAGVKKNTALSNFMFALVSSTDGRTPQTGVTVVATRSIDGGAFGPCDNAASEVGNGIYKIDLSADDLNGDVITLQFTGLLVDARLITIITEP